VSGGTVLSGCCWCHVLICRWGGQDPWHRIPARGELLLPQAAMACKASPDGQHHSPADYPEWPLRTVSDASEVS